MNELALFAGAGGGILGGKLLGWRTVCAVEFDPYARDVLLARQNDGCLPPFPVWDDVRTVDGRPWRGAVDVVSGGFPCQDISSAGKGAGIGGERSGLWREMARIIGEVQPRFVWVENSPLLVGRGLGLVLLDLAKMGFSARWGVVGACDAGAPHKRERIWIVATDANRDGKHAGTVNEEVAIASESVAYAEGQRSGTGLCQVEAEHDRNQPANGCGDVAHTVCQRSQGQREEHELRTVKAEGKAGRSGYVANADCFGQSTQSDKEFDRPEDRHRQTNRPRSNSENTESRWWLIEPDVGRVAHGVASRVDRLRCTGNGQVPAVVRLAWNTLAEPNK